MRRSALIITAAIVLALVGAGIMTANVLTLRNEPGVRLSVEPVTATPDPSLPTATPTPTAEPSTEPSTPPSPAPVAPAPPEDLDDDDDDDDDNDDDDDDDD